MKLHLALLVALVPAAAAGHGNQAPDGVDWSTLDDRSLIETTVGFLVSEDPERADDSWRWVCHEALSTSDSLAIPRYSLVPGGMLAAIFTNGSNAYIETASVYRTTDGCDWSPPSGLQDELVAGLAVNGGRVLAVTSNLTSANAALLSTDGGVSFTATALSDDPRALQGAGWAAEDRLLVGAAAFSPFEAFLLLSDDDGATWVERPLPAGATAERPLPLTGHPTDPDTLWFRMDGLDRDRVVATDDGGLTWTELLDVADDVLDATVVDDDLLLVLGDGSLLRGPIGGDLTPVADAPSLRATASSVDGLVYVADVGTEDFLVALLSDGELAPTLRFDQVAGPVSCPASSRSAQACTAIWEGVGLVIGAIEPETIDGVVAPPREEPKGCGGATALLPLLLPLGLVRRRSPCPDQPA